MIEHARDEVMPPGAEVRRYGRTAIAFYRQAGGGGG
jgi:hypothetical protein